MRDPQDKGRIAEVLEGYWVEDEFLEADESGINFEWDLSEDWDFEELT